MAQSQLHRDIITELWDVLRAKHGNKPAYAIAKQAAPYIVRKINHTVSTALKQHNNNSTKSSISNDDDGLKQGSSAKKSHNEKDYQNDKSQNEKQIEKSEMSRTQVRALLESEIKTAATPELRLKYIAELNKFDDNYSHVAKERAVNITIMQFHIPDEWRKDMDNKELYKG